MARVKSQKSQKRRKTFVRFLPIYILMLPGLIYLFINNYMPLPGLVIAFKQYNAGKGIYGSPWVGLKNFEYLFTTSDAFVITRNTILYNVAFIVINTTLAIAVAIILSELEGKRKKVYQSAILLPNLLSTVIIGYLVFAFFSVENGFINNTILTRPDFDSAGPQPRKVFGTEILAVYPGFCQCMEVGWLQLYCVSGNTDGI